MRVFLRRSQMPQRADGWPKIVRRIFRIDARFDRVSANLQLLLLSR